jgi:hypothetical protein
MSDMYSVMDNIIRCPLAEAVITGKGTNACSKIVKSQFDLCSSFDDFQGSSRFNDFQVPEPWRGHIDKAKILFVSSNPSISCDEDFPTYKWDIKSIENFFITCFDANSKFTKEGVRYKKKDGQYSDSIRFWASIKSIANEVIDNAVPGTDYAMTEVVHCKSRKEYGVPEACEVCPQRYFSSVISLSPAKVIIVLGETAKDVFISNYKNTNGNQKLFGPIAIEDKIRYVVFLPHSNAFKPHKLSTNLSPNQLETLRQFI